MRRDQRGFLLNPFRFGGGGGGDVVQALWSAVNKAEDILLLNGNRTAETSIDGGGTVLVDSGKTAGSFYTELEVTENYVPNESKQFGVHRGTSSLGTYIGGNSDGWSMADRAELGSGTFHNNTVSNSVGSGGEWAIGTICRIATDIGAGKIWLASSARSGGAWIGGGDPAAGTSPTYSFTPDGADYYIGACPRRGATDGNRNQFTLVQPDDWSFAAPDGFGVWN